MADAMDELLALVRARIPGEVLDIERFEMIRNYLAEVVEEEPSPLCPPGSLCESCLDAPAVVLRPAPWGGEMGVCAACAVAS